MYIGIIHILQIYHVFAVVCTSNCEYVVLDCKTKVSIKLKVKEIEMQ